MRLGPALAIALLCLPAALLAAETPSPSQAQAVFQAKCSTCHSVDRSLKKRKDRAGWERTVNRMKRYAAGHISDDDAAAIVDYLVRVRGPAD